MDEVEMAAEMDVAESLEHKEIDRWDRIGLLLSGLCAIHCLVTPLLILSLPLLAEKFASPWVHIVMALFVVPVGLFAFWSGYRHHQKNHILALGFAGLALIGSAAVGPHLWFGFLGDDLMTVIGSGLLICAHLLNRRACQCHTH